VAGSWATKLAMTAAVLGSSLGVNVDKVFAQPLDNTAVSSDVYVENPNWNGMPDFAKINVVTKLEALQIKIDLMPEAVQIKVEDKLGSVQHKVELR